MVSRAPIRIVFAVSLVLYSRFTVGFHSPVTDAPIEMQRIEPSINGMRALWGVFSGIGFERPGRGWEPVFSPDYTKFAYRAKMGGHEFIVIVTGRELSLMKLGTQCSVIGDEKDGEFDKVGPPIFSHDGSKLRLF